MPEDQPRELTEDEVRSRFLEHVVGMAEYWASDRYVPADYSLEQRLDGLAFSILVAIDGEAGGLPGFILAPTPHPDDREFCQDEGENWYPQNHEADVKCDIAGALHELYHVTAKGRRQPQVEEQQTSAEEQQIPLEDLETTSRTLSVAAANYHPGSEGDLALTSGRRYIERARWPGKPSAGQKQVEEQQASVEERQISLDDLETTWQTLRTAAQNYHSGSEGDFALTEARRLVEVEIRSQHGDEAWKRVTDG
jgi:hypothetical protein